MKQISKLSPSTKKWSILAVAIIGLIFFATIPFWLDVNASYFGFYFFMVCIYATLAQGWNLLAGYTGQISLGQNAFFGIGAYTMALMWFHLARHSTWFYFNPLIIILAGITPIFLALIMGPLLLSRLRGDYFAFGTLGMGMIVTVLFLNGGQFTGGAEGKLVSVDPSQFDLRLHYWISLLIGVVVTVVVYFMTTGKVGLALKAIREDEVSAASHGINILKYKVLSFVVAAIFSGMAGCIYGYYIIQVTPANVLNMNWLFYPILIVVLGGTGTILGPWIGSFLITALFAYGDIYFGGWHPVFSGVLIILVMLFMPAGIVGLMQSAPGYAHKLSLSLKRGPAGGS